MWANLCALRIARALRQHDRMQRAFRKMEKEGERIFEAYGSEGTMVMPKSFTDLSAVFDDHRYFFIVAARQAVSATEVLIERGEAMPAIRHKAEVLAWRNFEEHWDSEGRGQVLRARARWEEASTEVEPSLTYSSRGYVLTTISGISLKALRKDLRAALKAARAVSEREWLHCYITAAEAAEILGMTLEEFEAMPNKPTRMDFSAVDEPESDVRYFRDWVEARRDGTGIPPGWDRPFKVRR